MKYCKRDKTAAKDTDTVCSKCGGPLSVFGASTSQAPSASKPAAGPTNAVAPPKSPPPTWTNASPASAKPAATMMFTLQGEVERLAAVKQKNVTRGRMFSFLSLLIAVLILFVLYQVYARTVLDYAVLDNVRLTQDPVAESKIRIDFDVVTPGKVAFDRRSGSGRTEKVDLIAKAGPAGFSWAWPSDPKTGVDFSVVYRGGWLRTSLDKHFEITREGIGVDIVFLMDVTSSMQPIIQDLKQNCIDFADQIRREGVDCRLGLVSFGDVDQNEPIERYDPTSDYQRFQSSVANLKLTQGGDEPESSVEAIQSALEMTFRPHTRVCFVHITDAGCHRPGMIPELAETLKARSIITYVVSDRRNQRLYAPLCVNGGSFHGIRDARFSEILRDVAKSIVNSINND